jgi:two-component system chemotaxis sensor kinase CheA
VLDRTRVADLIGHLEGQAKEQDQEEIRQELSRTSVHLGRVTLDLQETIMKARMLPIEHLFRRFPRLVRDLGQKAGKKVLLEMSGLDTELDRMVMDELGDPLTHLVRNAVDHGVESPEKRRAAGKPETGKVMLRAGTEEGYVVIELADDGGGINVERVRQVALQRGVITPEQAERLTEHEAEDLIFAPGFSTASQVTEISGRGVGLDAVRGSLERLSGLIEVASERGVGTTFRLRIPLTLAIMRALLVRTGEEIYALPLGAVRQIVKLADGNVQQAYGRTLLADRGQLIPLHGLSTLYSGQDRPDETFAVVVGGGRQQVALRVEALLGEQEIVLKSFGDFLGAVPGLTGATILGDGQLALVSDVRFFLQGKEAS